MGVPIIVQLLKSSISTLVSIKLLVDRSNVVPVAKLIIEYSLIYASSTISVASRVYDASLFFAVIEETVLGSK